MLFKVQKILLQKLYQNNPEYRKQIKRICYREGVIITKATKPEEKTAYNMYYEFSEKVNHLPSHRILAINRGESEEFLKVKIEKPEDKILDLINRDIIKQKTQFTTILEETIEDSWSRLIEPSIEREIRSRLNRKSRNSSY